MAAFLLFMAIPAWLKHFASVPDPRVQRTRRYSLQTVLTVVLLGTICEAEGWEAMEDLSECLSPSFREALGLPSVLPCADTLRRVMGALDPVAFSEAFSSWAASLQLPMAGTQVAIDGKSVRGAQRHGGSALHVVHAWCAEHSMLLGQFACDVKSNEITAIPKLLKLLELRGAVVSIDAMGCQKNIAKCIRDKGAEYIFGLKGNHPTLHHEVLTSFDESTLAQLKRSADTYSEEADKAHGRLEMRRVWVQRNVSWLQQSEAWPGLCALVLVESERTIRGVTSREKRAYISSLNAPAERMASLVRTHWHVENRLHWVLDVTFGEDAARVHHKAAAMNLGTIRRTALNLLQCVDAMPGRSVAAKRRRANRSDEFLLQIVNAKIHSN